MDTVRRNAVITTIKNAYIVCSSKTLEEYRDFLVECIEELPASQTEKGQTNEG